MSNGENGLSGVGSHNRRVDPPGKQLKADVDASGRGSGTAIIGERVFSPGVLPVKEKNQGKLPLPYLVLFVMSVVLMLLTAVIIVKSLAG
jgi:hypothetical protein